MSDADLVGAQKEYAVEIFFSDVGLMKNMSSKPKTITPEV
jgi:hypothetical protein